MPMIPRRPTQTLHVDHDGGGSIDARLTNIERMACSLCDTLCVLQSSVADLRDDVRRLRDGGAAKDRQ